MVKTKPKPKRKLVSSKKSKPVVKPMMLTPKQFLALPFSSAIFQVIEDVKVLVKRGIIINMITWWHEGPKNKEPCSVCLGGAALCSFAPEKVDGLNIDNYGAKVLRIGPRDVTTIAHTFDYLRRGKVSSAFNKWYNYDEYFPGNIYDKYEASRSFDRGMIDTVELKDMLEWLSDLARDLRKAGF